MAQRCFPHIRGPNGELSSVERAQLLLGVRAALARGRADSEVAPSAAKRLRASPWPLTLTGVQALAIAGFAHGASPVRSLSSTFRREIDGARQRALDRLLDAAFDKTW